MTDEKLKDHGWLVIVSEKRSGGREMRGRADRRTVYYLAIAAALRQQD